MKRRNVGDRSRRKRMLESEKEKMTLQVAQVFCEKEASLSSISRSFGISRTAVDRLVKDAIKKGYIKKTKPKFCPPENAELEIRLRRAFSLKEAIVVPSPERPELLRSPLGSATAKYLEQVVFARNPRKKLTVGLSGGMSISQSIEKLSEAPRNVSVWPLRLLEPAPHPHYASASVLVPNFAKKCESDAFHIAFLETDYLENYQDWQAELDIFRGLALYKTIRTTWENLDVAIMGVGAVAARSLTVTALSRIGLDADELTRRGVKAILNLTLLCQDGSSVFGDLFLSIPIETLKRLSNDSSRHIILVAGGKSVGAAGEMLSDKIDAIHIVLTAHLANVLVTDDITAGRLLDKAANDSGNSAIPHLSSS